MAKHPLAPVKIHGTRDEMVMSFLRFVRHREEAEGKMPTALSDDYKAIKTLGRFRGVPLEVWPKPPTIQEKPRELDQTPEDIHALLHHDYGIKDAKNSYERHLIQYLLVFDFGFGPRMCSEAYTLKVGDFDPKRHLLTITESKKSMKRRRLLIEPEWLCCSPSHPSLAQYLKWRAKVDVGGTDAFFLKPNGEPFPSPEAIKQYLEGKVKPYFPWFHCYLGRTWNVNARLVDSGFDYNQVADWTGHASVEMIRSHYDKDARIHAKMYGAKWLERAFRTPKSKRTVIRPKTPLLSGVSPVEIDAPTEIRTRV